MRLFFDIEVNLSFIVILVRLAFSRFLIQKLVDRGFIWSLLLIVFMALIIISSSTLTAVKPSVESMETLKSDSHLPKKLFYLLQSKPFKNDEKSFLFHIKSAFHSQDI